MNDLTGGKIIGTYLSRKPHPQSGWVAAYGLTALMAVYLVFHQDYLALARWLSATPAQVFAGHEYWRAFTTSLVHADLEHFLANSFFFAGLSYLLYGYFGLWVFPVLSFAAGGVINLLTLATHQPTVTLVGASGVVYFMAAFWLALYVGIERGLSIPRRLINSMALSLVLFAPETFQPRVSYRAHAIGYLVGWVCGLL